MKRALAFAAAVLLLAVVSAGAALALRPFETVTAWRRLALEAAGVRRVTLDGGLLAWERDSCRPGAPCRCVALIHGLGDSALTWDKLLRDPRAGAPGLRLDAVDMPGTDGSAPAGPAGYGVRAQADALKTALAGRCPAWTVAGNSLGGWTAQWLALRWPAGVRSLVLVDAAGIDDRSGDAVAAARTLEDPTVAKLKDFSRRASYRDREIPERAWASAVASIRARPTRATVQALTRKELLDRRLSKLKVPTTIVWGDADRVIPPAVGARLHRLIAGSRYELIRRCGHLPQQECPEPVARAVFGLDAR